MPDNNLFPKVRYYHLRSRRNIVNLTVCTVELPGSGLLRVGAAFCHRVDSFIKKEGRDLALERAIETPMFTLVVLDESHTTEKKRVLQSLLSHSGDGPCTPSWAPGLYRKYMRPRAQKETLVVSTPTKPVSLWGRGIAWFVNALK